MIAESTRQVRELSAFHPSLRKVSECRTLDPCEHEENPQLGTRNPSAQLIERIMPSFQPALRSIHTTSSNLTSFVPQTVTPLSSNEPSIPYQVHVSTTIARTGRHQHRNPEGEMARAKKKEIRGNKGNRRDRKTVNCEGRSKEQRRSGQGEWHLANDDNLRNP